MVGFASGVETTCLYIILVTRMEPLDRKTMEKENISWTVNSETIVDFPRGFSRSKFMLIL